MFVLLKSHIWWLDSPLFPVSSNWDLWASSLYSPICSIQFPSHALGQVYSLFPSVEWKCRWPHKRGVIWKNSWKRARDLREPHGVTNPSAFQRLVITNKEFSTFRGRRKRAKRRKEINPVVWWQRFLSVTPPFTLLLTASQTWAGQVSAGRVWYRELKNTSTSV